jgi:AcrR family transcriptional regulator
MTKNQYIKADRIKSYFIAAARDIILAEGITGISVRRVADKAGYSYATIYNYYADLQDLLWDVKKSFIFEMKDHVLAGVTTSSETPNIKAVFHAYVSYYVEYPNVFKFFYQYPTDNEKSLSGELQTLFTSLSEEAVQVFSSFTSSDAGVISRTCIYAVHGMLMLFFSGNGMTRESLFNDLAAVLDHVCGNKERG